MRLEQRCYSLANGTKRTEMRIEMNFATRETVERLRKQYPAGCRVVLECMDDPQAPPIGTKGTVKGVDDTGSIKVNWDSGGSLSVVYGADSCRRIEE